MIKFRNVSVGDLAILLYNVWKAANTEGVGFEDPKHTVDSFVRKLHKITNIHTEDLESALWCCNLLSEKNEFWHPRGVTCEDFIKNMLSYTKSTFNKDYNYIEDESDKK